MIAFRRRRQTSPEFEPTEPVVDAAEVAETELETTEPELFVDPPVVETIEPCVAEPAATSFEQSLESLTAALEQCTQRLTAVETRLDELSEQTAHAPSHSDVLEVRMHSAKLAAELARATVELRGEIGAAGDDARRALRASGVNRENESGQPRLDLVTEEAKRFTASA